MLTLQDKMAQDLELAGYAPRTRQAYLASIRQLERFHGRSGNELDQDAIREWVRHLARGKRSSARLRQHFAALKFLYARTLGLPSVTAFLSWPAARQPMPVVLSPEEVAALLNALRSPKYRVFFSLVYATGMRLCEACRLETSDIDAHRGVIRVRHGKGGRERFVMLSPRLLGSRSATTRVSSGTSSATLCTASSPQTSPDSPHSSGSTSRAGSSPRPVSRRS